MSDREYWREYWRRFLAQRPWRPILEIKPRGLVYLRRWHLTPQVSWLPFCIFVHEILQDDDDRALHDHPWPNWTLSFWRGYWELRYVTQPVEGEPVPAKEYREVKPWRIYRRDAKTPHRIVLRRDSRGRPLKAWSLFFMGRKVGTWGFWCETWRICHWVHWKTYNAPGSDSIGESSTGRGCGE